MVSQMLLLSRLNFLCSRDNVKCLYLNAIKRDRFSVVNQKIKRSTVFWSSMRDLKSVDRHTSYYCALLYCTLRRLHIFTN